LLKNTPIAKHTESEEKADHLRTPKQSKHLPDACAINLKLLSTKRPGTAVLSLLFPQTKNSKNSLIMGSPVAVSGTIKKQEFSKKTAAIVRPVA